MILSSRELAGIVWLLIVVAWACSLEGVRKSIPSLVKALLSPKLLVMFSLIIGYNVAVIWGLWRLGLWTPEMLYDTVLFVAVGGLGAASRAAKWGVTYDRAFFAKTVLVNLELTALVTFLSDFFPFSFFVEFLVVIPLMSLLAMITAFSGHQEGAQQVHRLLLWIQGLVGLLLLAYVGWRVVTGFSQLLRPAVLFELALPLVMSVLFVPALFLVCMVMAYEEAFRVLSFKTEDKRLSRWRQLRLFLRFGLDLPAMQQFRRSPAMQRYRLLENRGEARAILRAWPSMEAESLFEGA